MTVVNQQNKVVDTKVKGEKAPKPVHNLKIGVDSTSKKLKMSMDLTGWDMDTMLQNLEKMPRSGSGKSYAVGNSGAWIKLKAPGYEHIKLQVFAIVGDEDIKKEVSARKQKEEIKQITLERQEAKASKPLVDKGTQILIDLVNKDISKFHDLTVEQQERILPYL